MPKSKNHTAKNSTILRNKEQSQRQLKVSQLLMSAVIDCLRKAKGLDELLLNMPLTITKVTVSTDLRIASCYFLPFNTILTSNEISDALARSNYAIRAYVTKEINLKYSPEIKFYFDHAFDNFSKIEALLKK